MSELTVFEIICAEIGICSQIQNNPEELQNLGLLIGQWRTNLMLPGEMQRKNIGQMPIKLQKQTSFQIILYDEENEN